MRHLITTGLILLAASTAAAAPSNGPPQTVQYKISNFHAYWALGVVIETSFDVQEKDTGKPVAHCAGKKEPSITPSPDLQPLDLGRCQLTGSENDITATVGGSPGQNFLIYLQNVPIIPCGPKRRYEAAISFSDEFYYCKNREQNGNSAICDQNAGAVIELPLHYVGDQPESLHRRDEEVHRC